jgi:hypothetical protein
VNGFIPGVWMIEITVYAERIFHTFLVSAATDLLEHRGELVQIFDGFAVSHAALSGL